jgi:hypothetical protein
MRTRRETVEHPCGTIKARMGATHFLMKRLRSVAAEMTLHVLAYHAGDEHRRQSEPDSSHSHHLKAGKCVQKRDSAPQ